MLMQGKMQLLGDGIPTDKKEGAYYNKLSADLRNDTSMFTLAFLLYILNESSSENVSINEAFVFTI